MLLQVNNLSKGYKSRLGFFSQTSKAILRNVSFQVESGESVGLLGQSGSGKSTLARLICGIDRADRGDILLNGESITHSHVRRGKISLVLQDYFASINPTMNVFQAVSESLLYSNLSLQDKQESIAQMLKKVGLSPDLMERYPSTLSGGQAQRVAICRALIHQPDLIVLDEPTSALDVVHQVQLLDLLLELKQEFQLSYFFISHNIQVLSYLCDRLLFLQQGCIIEDCAVSALAYVKQHEVRNLLNVAMQDSSL